MRVLQYSPPKIIANLKYWAKYPTSSVLKEYYSVNGIVVVAVVSSTFWSVLFLIIYFKNIHGYWGT